MREVSATGGSSTSATTADRPALSSFDLFVAVDETRAVVGYLLAVRGDPTHVAEVVVDADHRRQGYGRALVDRLRGELAERHGDAGDRSGHRVTLAVSPDNDGARAFYQSLDFTVARREDDYFDGAPALLLVTSVGDEST
jgi:ribosomal protein S18 acetylase RimI-like enzyme